MLVEDWRICTPWVDILLQWNFVCRSWTLHLTSVCKFRYGCKNLNFELTFEEEGPGAAVAGLAAASRDISGLESSRRTCCWTLNCIRCSFVLPLLLRRGTEDLLVTSFPRLLAGDDGRSCAKWKEMNCIWRLLLFIERKVTLSAHARKHVSILTTPTFFKSTRAFQIPRAFFKLRL